MANQWSDSWSTPAPPDNEEFEIISEVKKRFTQCEAWEANARLLFEYDYKFANADAHNKYQWDSDLVLARELDDKPCLTINKTQQHNLMIINDAKQNKPGVRIRPVGDEATFEGAQIYQELIYHIEYISNAENVYDDATKFQVDAGWGYWRVCTDYISDKTFDQEIYIRRIKDPRSVYLDPDINEMDGSDARYGIIFEDMPKDLYQEKYPEFKDVGSNSSIGNANNDAWITQNNVRIAEYYRKIEKAGKLVTWIDPQSGVQVLKKLKDLDQFEKLLYPQIKANKEVKEYYQFQERKVIDNQIEWLKIAGDRIIERGEWPGKYIPIVRLVGTETVIDGILDRKGHTRALINAQQIYNYNTSANVEYGALQTKSPWVAATAAIEGYEEYYKTANRVNHSYIPYNAIDEDGNPLPAPVRPAAPQASPAYVQQMQIAQNEMMMVTGQYQAQMGENENAKSGVAINARQRQGDRATYHFIDSLSIAVRFTGKILIDLIPKIYDTERIKKIIARDGTKMNVKIDPNFQGATKDTTDPSNPQMDAGHKIKEFIFNPDFGMYDIQADTGPSFATQRMETSQILTQIAGSDKGFLQIGGDVLFKNLDFNGADTLADRYYKMLPPALKGEAPDPHIEQMMYAASDKIEQQGQLITQLQQKLDDRDKELTIKAQTLDLNLKRETSIQAREDYKAETDRVRDLFNTSDDGSGPAPELKAVVNQLIKGMLKNGELSFEDTDGITDEDLPEGARRAPDGKMYAPQPNGGWAEVQMNA